MTPWNAHFGRIWLPKNTKNMPKKVDNELKSKYINAVSKSAPRGEVSCFLDD
jgi:hypothetical protein